jgi:hypothetical protein
MELTLGCMPVLLHQPTPTGCIGSVRPCNLNTVCARNARLLVSTSRRPYFGTDRTGNSACISAAALGTKTCARPVNESGGSCLRKRSRMKQASIDKLFGGAALFARANGTLPLLEGLKAQVIAFAKRLGCSTLKSSGGGPRGIEFQRKGQILFVFWVERYRAKLPGVAAISFSLERFESNVGAELEAMLGRLRERSGISVPTDETYRFSPVGFKTVASGAAVLEELDSFFRDALEDYGNAAFTGGPRPTPVPTSVDSGRFSGSDPNEPPPGVDPTVWRQICERRGQRRFRRRLLAAYENRCAVTGCAVVAAIEAAHLTQYSKEAVYGVNDGIILRADIHTLFDLHLLTIEPKTLKVRLDQSLAETYGDLEGERIRTPKLASQQPNEDRLRRHFEQWEKLVSQGD